MSMAPFTWLPPIFRATIPPSLRAVTNRPCHRDIILPCHLPHRATCYQHAATVSPCHLARHRNTTVPPATNMPQPCRRVTWCAPVPSPRHHRATTVPPSYLLRHRGTTVPPCHLVCHRDTTVPPCHLVHHHDTAVPPCRRAAAGPTRHIDIPPYAHSPCIINHAPDSFQSYLRSF